MNAGDSLARGAKSASFTASDGVSQEKWDAIFADYNPSHSHAEELPEHPDDHPRWYMNQIRQDEQSQ